MTSLPTPPRSPRRVFRGLVAALLGAWSAVCPLPARGQAVDAPPLTETMEVILVNVEVWVTDKEGIPVRGLKATDFEILEDGVPVPISHFAEIQEKPMTGRVPHAPLPPSTPDAPPLPPPATEEPPTLVVYFDQLHLTPTSTRRMINDLKSFLTSGSIPLERVLVIRQGFDLFTEASFGSNRQQIDDALTRIAKSPSLAQVDSRLALSRLQQLWNNAKDLPNPCQAFLTDARGEIATFVTLSERSGTATLDNLQRTARMLATLPGPKTLLFVSEAMETRPGGELFRFVQNTCAGDPSVSKLSPNFDAAKLTRELQSFADEANRNRITVYPFQASGLQAISTMGPDQTQLDNSAVSGVEGMLRTSRREGLVELARQTGGWAVVDRNRFGKEFDRLGTDMSTYYSLAYSPRRPGGTANHSIDVRTTGTLAQYTRLRHRLSYRDKEPADVLRDRLEGAVAFGAQRNPLGVRIAAGTLGQANEGRYGMPLHVLVPAEGIAFLPQGDKDQASIKVSILASNPQSRQRVTLEESFTPVRPPASSQLLDLRMVLQLPEGVHIVAVAVRDEVTGESSVVATTVAIHDPAAAGASPSR